jgi:hypothetical protein
VPSFVVTALEAGCLGNRYRRRWDEPESTGKTTRRQRQGADACALGMVK